MNEKREKETPKEKRPTMKDIAALVGVHQTTVSLALRGHPGISKATTKRIQEAAVGIGYRKDPDLDAFNEHRTEVGRKRANLVIGSIVDEAFLLTGPDDGFAQRRLRGITAAAAEMGLQLEQFVVGSGGLSPSRLDSILFARRIEGVVVAGLAYETSELPLSWERYAAVCIQSKQLGLRLDNVSTDLRHCVRLAVRRLRDLGYRRIGLTTAWEDEDWLVRSMTSGYLAESVDLPTGDRIPPYLFATSEGPVGNTGLTHWVVANRVEVVISNWNNVPEALEQGGFAIPGTIGFASLDLGSEDRLRAGVLESHEQVGKIAVEHLAVLMQSYTRGLMEVPSAIFVPGVWKDGPTAPGL